MTNEETILAQFGAIELVLTTMCRMLPQVQRNALVLAVEAAEDTTLNSALSDEAVAFLIERARTIIGPDSEAARGIAKAPTR